MKNILLYINTILKLGILNVTYVFWYRISLKTGLRKYFFKQKHFESSGDYFKSTEIRTDYPNVWKQSLVKDADRIIHGELRYFAYHWEQVTNPPNWFLNPFNGAQYPNSNLHWTKLPDFNFAVGDIKNIWEASRLEWVVTLSRAYAVTGESAYLKKLNSWLNDWTEKNPLNTGPNWKCGQEASIRLFNLINAALILQQAKQPTKSLSDLVYSQLERINGNILYAIVQDNNHGTSEAAGLFIGGTWLSSIDSKRYPRAATFSKKGRFWLENRIYKLIEPDGSFSQHSVTYHRVMLDTLCFAEFWRSKLSALKFSSRFYQKAKAATNWLWLLTDEQSGDAPNMGSNDGAFLMNMHSSTYRDFSPTIQLANNLFSGSCEIKSDKAEEVFYWLGLDNQINIKQNQRKSITFQSGYTYLNSQNSWALIRWPHFRFRPSHNDVMHFDLWFKGQNIVCDSGTYSYNPPANEVQYDLKSVHFHNSVSFDGKEQMPKIGRFLLGNWLKADPVSEIKNNVDGTQEWSGSYTDNQGNHHLRSVSVMSDVWQITDTLSGTFNEAIIGFNISDLNCKLAGDSLETDFGNITIPKNAVSFLEDSVASSYYWEKHTIKRLAIKVVKPGTYTTMIDLK